MLVTTLVVSFCKDGRSSVNIKLWFLVVCVRCEVLVVLCRLVVADNVCYNLQPGHYSSLTAPNLQPTATKERIEKCGYQYYSLDLLMMGIVVPETC